MTSPTGRPLKVGIQLPEVEGIAHVQLVVDPITRPSIEALAPAMGILHGGG